MAKLKALESKKIVERGNGSQTISIKPNLSKATSTGEVNIEYYADKIVITKKED